MALATKFSSTEGSETIQPGEELSFEEPGTSVNNIRADDHDYEDETANFLVNNEVSEADRQRASLSSYSVENIIENVPNVFGEDAANGNQILQMNHEIVLVDSQETSTGNQTLQPSEGSEADPILPVYNLNENFNNKGDSIIVDNGGNVYKLTPLGVVDKPIIEKDCTDTATEHKDNVEQSIHSNDIFVDNSENIAENIAENMDEEETFDISNNFAPKNSGNNDLQNSNLDILLNDVQNNMPSTSQSGISPYVKDSIEGFSSNKILKNESSSVSNPKNVGTRTYKRKKVPLYALPEPEDPEEKLRWKRARTTQKNRMEKNEKSVTLEQDCDIYKKMVEENQKKLAKEKDLRVTLERDCDKYKKKAEENQEKFEKEKDLREKAEARIRRATFQLISDVF